MKQEFLGVLVGLNFIFSGVCIGIYVQEFKVLFFITAFALSLFGYILMDKYTKIKGRE